MTRKCAPFEGDSSDRGAALVARVRPLDVAFELEETKRRTRLGERKKCGSDVVYEAGLGRFFRTEGAARPSWVRFDDEHAISLFRKCRGGNESIRTGSDHDHVGVTVRHDFNLPGKLSIGSKPW